MKNFMKHRLENSPAPLDTQEREMFSAAFKRALSDRRQALHVLVSYEKEAQQPHLDWARDYASKVRAELMDQTRHFTWF